MGRHVFSCRSLLLSTTVLNDELLLGVWLQIFLTATIFYITTIVRTIFQDRS